MPSTLFRALAVAVVLASGATMANPLGSGSDPLTSLNSAAGATSTFNPLGALLHPLEMRLTNAQRMARGLPPNKPHFRRADRASRPRARPSATPATANTQACSPRNGVIHVTATGVQGDDSRPAIDGYLSNVANEFGEYGYTTDRTNALTVSINDCNGTPFDIVTSNGFSAFPYLGGIKGFSSDNADLRGGSFNYVYIGGVSETAPLAAAQNVPNSFSAATDLAEPSESSIWAYQQGSNTVLQAQWVNTDGSLPATTLAYVAAEGVFVLLGDVPAFEQNIENVSPATFTFEG